jgi:hypothetical protein
MSELMTTTYSMWRLFRNCRKACEYRYLRDLVPLERDHNLAFGSVIHDCLEVWHGRGKHLGNLSGTTTEELPFLCWFCSEELDNEK